jgi:uncharacterized OsmC-like protein
MDDRFKVSVGAGTMMSASGGAVRFPHRWTPGGVTVEADFTGAHLLHLAAAGCILNDVHREAAALRIEVTGVRVIAASGFDAATSQSTGIGYSVEVSSDAPADQLDQLLRVWTRWPRFLVPSGPEPPLSGSADPCRTREQRAVRDADDPQRHESERWAERGRRYGGRSACCGS